MKQIEKILGVSGGAKIMLVVPLPRYVKSACCGDTSHVANRQESEFISELTGAEKCLAEVAAAGDLTREARIINIVSFFGSDESANKRARLESVIPSAPGT
jgi:hypothetical protein